MIPAGQSFSITETDATGALVGTVGTTGDTPATFAIIGGNVNNAFAIDAGGTITVADSSALDFETISSYTLTIEVSDGAISVFETVTITVTDVAETSSSGDTGQNSGGSGPSSNPPSSGGVALVPEPTPDVPPEADTPEPVSEDSSISSPTPAADVSPEPRIPPIQVANPPSRLRQPEPRQPEPRQPEPRQPEPQPSETPPQRVVERVILEETPVPDNLIPPIHVEGLLQELDEMRAEVLEDVSLSRVAIGSTLTLTTGLSIGYVLWLIRGGLLLSSLLSSLPAWRFVDPLPVLAHLDSGSKEDQTDDDSLESVIRKGADMANSQPEPTSHMDVNRDVAQPGGSHRI